MPKPKPKKYLPYMPWEPSKPIVVAIQCVASGTASPEQQILAMKHIIEGCCRYTDMAWFPGDEEGKRLTDFASGRRFVGQELVRQIKFKVGLMKKEQDNG